MDGEKGSLKQDMTHTHFSGTVCVQNMKDAPEAECVLRGMLLVF